MLIQLLVILLFGACSEDFFNEVPSDRITPNQHYKSKVDADLSCLAPLAILRGVIPQMVFASDLLSDATTISENVDPYWQDINNHVLSADNPYINPSVLYQVIVNANESLLYIDEIAKSDKDITALDIKVYKGSLIGIRSWAYFYIARLYGEVAYIKDNLPEYSADKIVYLPRVVMLDTLINQLTPFLEIDYIDNLVRGVNSMYNKALIGEIYLEKQDYDNAVKHLRMAIEGYENLKNLYKVSKNYAKAKWINLFINSASQLDEIMIAVPFTFANQTSNPIEMWYGYNYQYLAKPSDVIINLFNNEGDKFRGLGASYTIVNEKPIVNKYNLDPGLPLSSDIILYRSADIHLLLAEAMNRVGYSDIALNILNDGNPSFINWDRGAGVRGRVGLKPVTVPEGVDVVNYIEDKIIEERAMELAFEGKRWFDLMRLARRRGNDYLAGRVAAKYTDPILANTVREKLMNEENWYLPFRK